MFGATTLFTSLIFSYLLVSYRYFPYLSLGLFFIFLSTTVFIVKKEKNWLDYVFYAAAFIFSIFLFYRANGFLTILNIMGILYAGSMLVQNDPKREKKEWSLVSLLFSPFLIVFKLFGLEYSYDLNPLSLFKNRLTFDSRKIYQLILSIGVTCLLLVIILPLLSYSNPFFQSLLGNFLKAFNLTAFFDLFSAPNWFLIFVRVIVFLVLVFFIPGLATYAKDNSKEHEKWNWVLPLENFTIPKVAIGVVLLLFFITQAQLYFASDAVLKTLGYSNSQHAREMFAHLSIVTLIIFSLIYNDKSRSSLSRLLTYILIIEGFFLNMIAFKSDYDYASNWGFTHKRLYGFAGVVWIFGLFLLYGYSYVSNLKNSLFTRNVAIFSFSVLLGINLVNFDYLIYHYAKSTTHSGIDYLYLSRLSTDAGSQADQLQKLMSEIEQEERPDIRKVQPTYTLIYRIEYLKEKYKKFDIRTFNFSEFSEYQKVKDLDVKQYRNTLDTKQYQGSPVNYEVPVHQQMAPRTITVTLINLEKNLVNHNFEVKNENGQTLVKGSLDTDSYKHTFGVGGFYLILYDYQNEKDKAVEIPVKKLRYDVLQDEVEKVIDLHSNTSL